MGENTNEQQIKKSTYKPQHSGKRVHAACSPKIHDIPTNVQQYFYILVIQLKHKNVPYVAECIASQMSCFFDLLNVLAVSVCA